jgi:hypothetical protein
MHAKRSMLARMAVWLTAAALAGGGAGCATVVQEVADTAAARRAALEITGSAEFVNLEYALVDHEVRGAPDVAEAVSKLGNKPDRQRLPYSRSFLVNVDDELHVYCELIGPTGTAAVALSVDGRPRRSYVLTSRKPRITMSQRF